MSFGRNGSVTRVIQRFHESSDGSTIRTNQNAAHFQVLLAAPER
jgi:hypothetical protein